MNVRCSRSALFLVLAAWEATPALAQGTMAQAPMEMEVSRALDRPARLDLEALPLRDALTRLSETAGVAIAFSPSAVQEVATAIACSCAALTVGEALERLLVGTSFKYSELNGQVVVSRAPEREPRATDRELRLIAPAGDAPRAAAVRNSLPERGVPLPASQVVGTVTNETTKEPIPSVQVSVEGTRLSTLTDQNGRFAFTDVPPGRHTIIAQSIGYGTQRVAVTLIDGQTVTVSISMATQAVALDEIVVVGYAAQKRQNLTGAVSVVDVGKNVSATRPVTDVARGLQGVTPGLIITTSTGNLGEEPVIRLRGTVGSLNTGSEGAKPLILVDGAEIESLQRLNPEDVQSITVLKDAASTSIYGARAAFGVVLITTKTGQRGTGSKITYSNNISYNTPTQTFKLMNAYDQVTTSLAAVQRFAPNQTSFLIIGMTFDEYAKQKIKEWDELYGNQKLSNEMVYGRDFEIKDNKLYFFRPWDPAAMYMRKWTPQQTHNLTISGGSERTSYNIGLGVVDQKGILKVNSDEYRRYNVSLAVDNDVTDWLGLKTRINISKTSLRTPYVFQSEDFNNWYYLYRWTTLMPYGTYQGLPFHNAITQTELANLNDDDETFSRISTAGTFRLANDLTLDAEYTYSQTDDELHERGGGVYAWEFWGFTGALRYENYLPADQNRVRYTSGRRQNNVGRLYATYRRGTDHRFQLLGGGDLELTNATQHTSERRNLLDFNNPELALATGDQFAFGTASQWSTLGAFGRLNYSYRDKYLLELNARYDGSSRFPLDQLWGFFPSASAGWVLTEEPFMTFSRGFLDFLKVRASYGSVGNQNVGANRFLATMSSNSSGWEMPTGIARSMSTPGAVSPLLTWETVTTANLGFDANLLNNRLALTFEWYRRTTSDMISAGTTLPATFGATAPVRNFGELEGKGWELSLKYNQEFSNGLKFSATGSLSDGREKITKFYNPARPISGNYEGRYIGDIWGFVTDRLFQEDDFAGTDPVTGRWIYRDGVPNQNALETGAFRFGPGDVKYKDLNGDGVITLGQSTVDDPGDQKIIGNSTPRYQYGLRLSADWKRFDLSTYLQGIGKRQFWNASKLVTPGRDNSTFGAAWFDYQIDYWRPDNTGAFYARPTNNDGWNYRSQTRYLLDMAYLRVKNITLGYTVPRMRYVPVDRLRLYVSGENLFALDKLDIPVDPETGLVNNTLGASYPYRTTLSFGVQTTF